MPMLTDSDIITYHRLRDMFTDVVSRRSTLQPAQKRELVTGIMERLAQEGITITLPPIKETPAAKAAASGKK